MRGNSFETRWRASVRALFAFLALGCLVLSAVVPPPGTYLVIIVSVALGAVIAGYDRLA